MATRKLPPKRKAWPSPRFRRLSDAAGELLVALAKMRALSRHEHKAEAFEVIFALANALVLCEDEEFAGKQIDVVRVWMAARGAKWQQNLLPEHLEAVHILGVAAELERASLIRRTSKHHEIDPVTELAARLPRLDPAFDRLEARDISGAIEKYESGRRTERGRPFVAAAVAQLLIKARALGTRPADDTAVVQKRVDAILRKKRRPT